MHASLLAHIAAALPQKENLATSALAYILNSSDVCRQNLSSLLSHLAGDCGEVARVRLEEPIDGGGRPDVRLSGADGRLLGLMEVKFWAGLTAAQPGVYLDALRSHRGSILVFLAPNRRLTALRSELIDRCRAEGRSIDEESGFRLQCGDTRLVLVSWAQLLQQLSLAAAGDAKVAGDVEQLRGLCSLIDEEGDFSMSCEELSDVSAARRVRRLNGLVDTLVDRLKDSNHVDTRGLIRTSQEWGYGRYLRLAHVTAWLGVDNYSWGQHGRSPIWLMIARSEVQALKLHDVLQDWIRAVPPKAYADNQEGRILVPLPMRPGAVVEDTVAGFIETLESLSALLDAAGAGGRGCDS